MPEAMPETALADTAAARTAEPEAKRTALLGGRIPLARLRDLALVPATGVIAIVGQTVNPVFLQADNLINVLQTMSEMALLVLAQAMVLIVKKMDLSLESTMGLAPGVAAWLVVPTGAGRGLGLLPGAWAIPVTLAVGALVGVVNALLIIWDAVFSAGVRWFHTSGVFAGLSDTTVDVADDAMAAARRHGVTVSYDPNHRPSLWAGRGGADRAREVDLRLARHADVVVGALGLAGTYPGQARIRADEMADALAEVADLLPGARVLATPLRDAPSAGVNDWSSAAWSAETGVVTGPVMTGLHVLDRIGSGDAFAAGLIHGLLGDTGLERALAYGTAHGALAMTTPGDVSMASPAEVEALIAGGSAHVRR